MDDLSRQSFEKACALIPGGVNSPVRACHNVDSLPLFVAEAHGGRLTAVDGREYIDFVLSWGPMILGHDVWSDVNTAKRMIGVMPQPDQIFDRLTGLQLLVYSGMLRGMSREETTRRAQDLLNAFDLAGAANTMVTDYSAGMTKKICLASEMIHSPRILVLDEPFESVDPVSSANLKDILIEYAKTGGTVIISSHVMALVEKMCTHVAVINDGLVCAAGTVDEVAAGEELEDRFLQLVGGRHEAAHLAWLDGGQAQAQAPTSAQTIQPILPTPATPTDEARQ